MNKSIAVKELPNIGPVLAKELGNAGIRNLSDLKKLGSAKALFAIKGVSGKGCCNMLYALEGAIKQVRWHELTQEEKTIAKNKFLQLLNK